MEGGDRHLQNGSRSHRSLRIYIDDWNYGDIILLNNADNADDFEQDVNDSDYDDDDGDDGDDVDDGDDGDDVDIYIMMMCLSVCHEKWSLPPGSLL